MTKICTRLFTDTLWRLHKPIFMVLTSSETLANWYKNRNAKTLKPSLCFHWMTSVMLLVDLVYAASHFVFFKLKVYKITGSLDLAVPSTISQTVRGTINWYSYDLISDTQLWWEAAFFTESDFHVLRMHFLGQVWYCFRFIILNLSSTKHWSIIIYLIHSLENLLFWNEAQEDTCYTWISILAVKFVLDLYVLWLICINIKITSSKYWYDNRLLLETIMK